MTDYIVIEGQNVIRRASDGAWIPMDPANLDYQAYVAWCDAGNVPDVDTPAEPKTV